MITKNTKKGTILIYSPRFLNQEVIKVYFFSITENFEKEQIGIQDYLKKIASGEFGAMQVDYHRIIICSNEEDTNLFTDLNEFKKFKLKNKIPQSFIFESNLESVRAYNKVSFILQRWAYHFLEKRQSDYYTWYNKSKIFDYSENKMEDSKLFEYAKKYAPFKAIFSYYVLRLFCYFKAWILRFPIIITVFIKDSFLLSLESYKVFKEKESKYNWHKMISLETIFTKNKNEIERERKALEIEYQNSKKIYLESNKTLLTLIVSVLAVIVSFVIFKIDNQSDKRTAYDYNQEMGNYFRLIGEKDKKIYELILKNEQHLMKIHDLEVELTVLKKKLAN
ncbi:hypothetical protein [Leptospira interrogans]|uniref:hypothetical protein n=1 Tax=Leptospira interrogans TaxID=173 RepID=UPI0002B96F06|nr:hypothetical protein [Leptospira interrogans]OAM85592.1 hypothetical protein A1343_17540 [Leptospira interrogans serovar Bataviae]QOI40747.1 hypothetical protein Lepto1548_21145 [Leptospira interrogans serovar Bataviae]QYY62586.1 hypothetical protein GR153_019595 [Leptospira interrogans serovar Bataviae]